MLSRLGRARHVVAVMSARARARRAGLRGVTTGKDVRFGARVSCKGNVQLGAGVEIAAAAAVVALPGGRIVIGDNVFIGGHSLIAASTSITVGRDTMISDLVTIRDHDHDPAFPPRAGKMLTEPIAIGQRVWIGAKASVARGVTIGDDAVIGGNAFVSRAVPSASLAVGVPARVVREHIR